MSGRRKLALSAPAAFGAILIGLVAVNLFVSAGTRDRLLRPGTVRPAQAVLLLGARVYADGRVSHIVEDRIRTAVEIYEAGKAEKILVSGDHGQKSYDEVNTIRKKLLAAGVRADDIFMDHAGFNTYDSLYRAKAVFQARSLIIVTQEFHLGRALFLADCFGIPAEGAVADRRRYRDHVFNHLREFAAAPAAFLNALIFKPRPRFLGEAVSLDGDGRTTWDNK